MSKVIRISDRNLQYLEELRELFAKIKFYGDIDWTDEMILKMSLTNMILEVRKHLNHEEY